MIKITHILPSLNIGGVQKYILALSQLDYLNGVERKVITVISKEGDLKDEFILNNIDYKYCPIKLQDKNLRPYRLIKKIRELASITFFYRLYKILKDDDSDIVCSIDITNIISQLLISLLLKKRFLLYIHTEKSVLNFFSLLIIFLLRSYSRVIIVSVSKMAAKKNLKFIFRYMNSHQLKIIPSARDVKQIVKERKNKLANRALYNVEPEELIIGSIGRLHWSKGYDLLIHSIIELKNRLDQPVKLFIAGDGPLKNELLKLIKQLNLKDNIILLGNINNISQFLNILDIYIQPSVS